MTATTEPLLLIGTYTERMPHVDGQGAGIHLLRFDQEKGTFGPDKAVSGFRNPTYLTASHAGDRVYAVIEIDDAEAATVETFALDADALTLTHLGSAPTSGSCPCHVSLNEDAGHLYVSNYASGNFAVYDLDAEGVPRQTAVLQRTGSGPDTARQDAAHAHCALLSPDGRHLYVVDLGTDTIARHPVTAGGVAPDPDRELATAPGAGPRHIAFSPSGRWMAGIHELDSTLSLYRLEGGDVREVDRIATLPADWIGGNTTAAVRFHPSGRFVYGSNRGHDSIVVAALDEQAGRLTPVGHGRIEGRSPRDFAITPNGRYLLAASQDDHVVTVFAIDPATGLLTDTGERLRVKSPVCLCFVPGASMA